MTLIRTLLLLLVVLLAGCAGINQADQGGDSSTSRTARAGQPNDVWERIRLGFAIPNLDTDLSRQWTDYYAAHPEAVQRMAQRAGKYLYFITDEINRRGMPTELALLPFVESAYKPTAQSSAQASGLWQFVPSTGQHYNLKQDWWRDERRDPIASTYAALDYLSKLYDMQGDWYLALASYNWGENSVQRAMARNQSQSLPADYLSLNMPGETRNYVPKLQAIKNIIANPQKYGIVLPPVENTPYFAMVSKPIGIDQDVAAQLAEIPLDEFKALNPSNKRPVVTANENGGSTLVLPTDKIEVFNRNFANYQGRLSNWRVYQPQRGTAVATVAKQLGISEHGLRQINGLAPHAKTVSGEKLLAPAEGVDANTLVALASANSELPPAAADPKPRAAAHGRKGASRHEARSSRSVRSAHNNRASGNRGVAIRSSGKPAGKAVAAAQAGKNKVAAIGHMNNGKNGNTVKVASVSKRSH